MGITHVQSATIAVHEEDMLWQQLIGVLILAACSLATGCNHSCAAGAYLDNNGTCQFCPTGLFSNAVSNATSCANCPEQAWRTSTTEGSTACTVCMKQFTPILISVDTFVVILQSQ